MARFYYLHDASLVQDVTCECIDFGTDETVYLQVVFNLQYPDGVQDTKIYYSEDFEDVDEALELQDVTLQELEYYYRDLIINPFTQMADEALVSIGDFLFDDDEIDWESIKGN